MHLERIKTPGLAHVAYLIGAASALLNICAFAAFRKGIGVSGAYESSAALAARRLAPDAVHVNDYVKARKYPPQCNGESWLVLGTILGGMAAARTLGGNDVSRVDDRPGAEPKRSPLASAAGGALLQRGGLADSRTIVGQLTGDDARVGKTMGTAVAVGALGHRLLHRRGLTTDGPKPMNPVGLVGGAVLFGAGMALSGYCPGTAAAGSGCREGMWAMAGMLAAAAVFVATYPRLKKALEARPTPRVARCLFDPTPYGTHSMPRTRPTLVYRPTKNPARCAC